MKRFFKTMAFTLLGLVLSVNLMAADPVVLFHETFGDNSSSARAWDNTYSVKSGVADVYSGVSYTTTNVKQGKNTTGQIKSGLSQSTAGTDAVFEFGPLDVSDYKTLNLSYYWKAASTKGTYTTKISYKTSKSGSYSEITPSATGATTFVQVSENLPSAVDKCKTLYLKIVFNTSNTQATIDEVELTGIFDGAAPTEPSLSVSPATIDFGTVYKDEEVDAKQVEVTFANLTTNDVTAAISGSAFGIDKKESFTSGDKITITPNTATIDEYEEILTLSATGVDDQKVTITMNVVEAPAFVTYNKVTDVNDLTEGDVIVLASSTTAYGVAPTDNHTYIDAMKFADTKNASLKDNVLKAVGAYELTLAKSGANWTMTGADGLVGTTAAKTMTFGSSDSKNVTTWSISIDGSANASITSTGSDFGTIKYNSSSPRFLNYASGQTAIQIYKKAVAPTNEAVTFAAPEGGSLVIKNGATSIESGTTIQNGTVLDVEFGMTPAEAYKDVAIKVTNASTSEDVTEKVYDATKKQITMPRYAITVAVTSTKLYKISLVKAGEGTGTATMNDVTTDIYVDGETQINLVASAVAPNEFTKWSATENILINEDDKAETYAYASGDGTITATFGISELQPLDAPTLSAPTNITYSGVTLNWQELANAEAYNVELLLNDETVASNVIIEETTWTPEVTLQANTTYTYTVQGVGDGTTYAVENNPKATSTFTTADYPAATLTLSENGATSTYSEPIKINTPFNLPDCSVECDKVFVGWSESNTDHSNLLDAGSSYTMTETTGILYAWFATVTPGTTTWNKVPTNYTDWIGNEFLIVYESEATKGYVMKQADDVNNYVEATIASGVIASKPTDAMSVIIEKFGTTDNYQLKVAGATPASYIKGASGNGLSFDASAQQTTISYDNTNGWLISNNSSWLRYNTTSGQTRFRFYKSTTYTQSSYKTVQFYKKSAGASSYSDYSLTCSAKANAPVFDLAEGTYTVAKELNITAEDGATIYYTLDGTEPDNTKTPYEGAIQLNTYGKVTVKAIAYVAEKEASDVVTKTYMINLPFASLADLVAASEANKIPNNNATVTVTLSNIEIASFNGTKGVNLNVICENKNVQIYNNTAFDTKWKVGGTLSHSSLTCTWQRYENKGTYQCWELMPDNWEGFVYNDPVHITSIAISGEPTNKDYSDGQQLNPAGLVVTGTYSDSPEHTEVITEGLTWTLPTLEEGATTAQVSVKYTEPVLSNELTSDPYQVTINAVTPAKTLQSIYVADDSEHKKEFFVGRPFSSDGLKVMAKYNIGEDQPIVPTSVTPPAMTSAGTKQVTVSYTEGGVTAEPVTYDITLTYMNLNDLVAATDINDHDHVYVKFENVTINKVVSKGIYLDVQKDDKDIEIYCQSTNHSADWEQYGTVSATLDNVEWTYFTSGSVWELMISNWNAFTYNEPNIPVTSMEISPAEVSVGEAKTTTLSIVYTPNNATNIGVTWAVTDGEEFAGVNAETGVVTGIKAGTATITATLTADPTITATRTVTVTETPKCTISYYVKDEVASTQEIVREEEGTLTYEPTLVVAGYTFAGWAEEAIIEESATATLITKYTPGAEETAKSVYAVFKRVDDSSPTYQQYAKVTSALTDWAGDYLIAYDDTHFANGKVGGESGIGAANASVNPEDALRGNVVTKEWGDQYKVTIEACTGGYLLKTQDNKYNYQSSNSNGLASTTNAATADDYPYTISLDISGKAKMVLPSKAQFQYNTAGYFRCYKDGGQSNCYLYKYDAGTAMYTSNPTAKVKVTFNLDGGVGGCGTITVNEGENVTLCGDAPTKDLNKFDAWSDGVNEYAPGATIEDVTEDIELTALWIAKQQYTISFNKGGAAGTTPASIKDYEYNEVTLPAQGDLSNPGYIFGGWNDGEITYAGGANFTMPEKNVSMTAVWVAKTNDKWVLVTSTDQLVAGSKYVIANNENDAVAGDITGSNAYMNKVNATFSDNKQFITAMAGQVELTLGGSTNAWTFAKDASNYLANSGTSLSWSTTASTWKIAFEDDKMTIVEGENNSLQYNTGSPRFKTYTSSQAAVQLYVLIPAQAINDDVDASTLPEQADVTVNEGGNLLIDAPKTLGDIYVMEGGKVTISGSATLTVTNFVIKSTMGGGQSGQVLGVTSTNFVVEENAYYDVVLGDNGNPDKWHAFAVPFNVDAINGVYDLDDNKLTNEVNYAIMDYHGDVRAQGQYGWKKFRGIMQPGVFYLMTVDGQRTTYRMKMNGGFHASSTTITVNQYASGTDTDAGWNGIANNQLNYSSIGVDVQVLNPTSYTFETMTASTYNFTVGTPFFYQANGEEVDGKITLAAANSDKPAYAPQKNAEAKNIAVTLGNDNYTDRLYISATDEATNEYQIGRDLVKMTMTNTPVVPQIFAEAYGTKLCMVDAPMMYDEAVYALNLYAPANGEYTMSAAQVKGYEVFLTQYGSVIWNLSMSEATIELTKGNNTEYGLILKATSGHAPTDINALNGQESVQKFLYNSNIYLRHNNNTFNVQGQLVK